MIQDPTEDELLFYKSVFEQAQQIFESYRKAGTIVKNYMHIFELLLRLRQCCDHNFLVLMCLTAAWEDRLRGAYAGPSRLRAETLDALKKGDASLATTMVRQLFSVSSTCCICMEDMESPMVTPCGHMYCRDCIHGWLDGGKDSCPICRNPVRKEQLIPKSQVRTLEEVAKQQNQAEDDKPQDPVEPEGSIYAFKDKGVFVSLRSTKVEAILDELIATRIEDQDRKTIIFSQFTMFLDLLEIPLAKAGFHFARLDGR